MRKKTEYEARRVPRLSIFSNFHAKWGAYGICGTQFEFDNGNVLSSCELIENNVPWPFFAGSPHPVSPSHALCSATVLMKCLSIGKIIRKFQLETHHFSCELCVYWSNWSWKFCDADQVINYLEFLFNTSWNIQFCSSFVQIPLLLIRISIGRR